VYSVGKRRSFFCPVPGKIDCPADVFGVISVYDREETAFGHGDLLVVNPVPEYAVGFINIAGTDIGGRNRITYVIFKLIGVGGGVDDAEIDTGNKVGNGSPKFRHAGSIGNSRKRKRGSAKQRGLPCRPVPCPPAVNGIPNANPALVGAVVGPVVCV